MLDLKARNLEDVMFGVLPMFETLAAFLMLLISLFVVQKICQHPRFPASTQYDERHE
jgi:hypothetical protein